MDLRRLKTFVTVAELGTVSKAAVHLRIGQPALSRQISDLQQELGLRLFDRVGRLLVLTAQGEQLLVDCRRVMTDLGRGARTRRRPSTWRQGRAEDRRTAAHHRERAVEIST
jgi:DNA-binding transcriptional LysR family regulator